MLNYLVKKKINYLKSKVLCWLYIPPALTFVKPWVSATYCIHVFHIILRINSNSPQIGNNLSTFVMGDAMHFLCRRDSTLNIRLRRLNQVLFEEVSYLFVCCLRSQQFIITLFFINLRNFKLCHPRCVYKTTGQGIAVSNTTKCIQ